MQRKRDGVLITTMIETFSTRKRGVPLSSSSQLLQIVSGQFVEGRAQAILAMTIGAGNILVFILTFLAADGLDYGYTGDPANWAPPMIMATGLLVSGYLYLEEE